MFKFVNFFILCFVIIVNATQESTTEINRIGATLEYPSCQIDSPLRNECIKGAIQDILPQIKNGFPSLNLPPIDPYGIDETNFNYTSIGGSTASITIRNLRVTGLSQAEVNRIKTNINETSVVTIVKTFIPEMKFIGQYQVDGYFNLLKLNSAGNVNITASNTSIIAQTVGGFIEKNGVVYLNLTNLDMNPTIDDLDIHFDGLFPDRDLTVLTNQIINQLWPVVYRELLPETKNIWEPFLLDGINKVLLGIPIWKFFYYAEKGAGN